MGDQPAWELSVHFVVAGKPVQRRISDDQSWQEAHEFVSRHFPQADLASLTLVAHAPRAAGSGDPSALMMWRSELGFRAVAQFGDRTNPGRVHHVSLPDVGEQLVRLDAENDLRLLTALASREFPAWERKLSQPELTPDGWSTQQVRRFAAGGEAIRGGSEHPVDVAHRMYVEGRPLSAINVEYRKESDRFQVRYPVTGQRVGPPTVVRAGHLGPGSRSIATNVRSVFPNGYDDLRQTATFALAATSDRLAVGRAAPVDKLVHGKYTGKLPRWVTSARAGLGRGVRPVGHPSGPRRPKRRTGFSLVDLFSSHPGSRAKSRRSGVRG